jgi:hypothetical protein
MQISQPITVSSTGTILPKIILGQSYHDVHSPIQELERALEGSDKADFNPVSLIKVAKKIVMKFKMSLAPVIEYLLRSIDSSKVRDEKPKIGPVEMNYEEIAISDINRRLSEINLGFQFNNHWGLSPNEFSRQTMFTDLGALIEIAKFLKDNDSDLKMHSIYSSSDAAQGTQLTFELKSSEPYRLCNSLYANRALMSKLVSLGGRVLPSNQSEYNLLFQINNLKEATFS